MVEYPRAGAAIIMMETGRQYPKEAQMSQVHIHPVPAEYKKQTLMDRDTYDRWYAQSINLPDTVWSDRSQHFLYSYTPWDTLPECDII